MAQECVARHVIYMVIHVVRLSVVRSLTLCSSLRSSACVSLIPSSSTWTLTCTSSSMWTSSRQYPTGTPPNEESGPLAENAPLTRPPPKISYKDNWMCDWDSDVAGSSKDTQRIEPKPKTELSSTVRPVCRENEEIEERTKFERDALNQEKHDEVTDPTSSVRPICGHESTKRCVLTPKHVEGDQTSTERPVLVEQKEEHKIEFRVPGRSHAVVEEAEHLRVQELVKRIENYPH